MENENAPLIVRGSAEVTLEAMEFRKNNNSEGSAGVIVQKNSKLTVLDSIFAENAGVAASAIFVDENGRVEILRSLFEQNNGNGSTLATVNSENITIANSNFTLNVASGGGCIHTIVSFFVEKRHLWF